MLNEHELGSSPWAHRESDLGRAYGQGAGLEKGRLSGKDGLPRALQGVMPRPCPWSSSRAAGGRARSPGGSEAWQRAASPPPGPSQPGQVLPCLVPTVVQSPGYYSTYKRAQWVKFCLQCRRPGFKPWVGKSPWRSEWQPTPVFLPGDSNGQRSLAGYSPWGCKSRTRLSD